MAPAGLEASMAGKADIVNGIVDRPPEYIQEIPQQEGWKVPESYADGGFASAQSSGTTPGDGSVRIGTGGGRGTQG
jgi:hypothetical protein